MNKQEIKNWLSYYNITKYTINDDLTVDVNFKVNLSGGITSLPFQFGAVNGDFSCSYNYLTSLKNCPRVVTGNFFCHSNKLTSLEHCPKIVNGTFWCHDNLLTSLEHAPKVITGSFHCDPGFKTDPNYLRWLLANKLKDL